MVWTWLLSCTSKNLSSLDKHCWLCLRKAVKFYQQTSLKYITFPKPSTGTWYELQSNPGSASNLNGLILIIATFPSPNKKLKHYFCTIYLIHVQHKKRNCLSWPKIPRRPQAISFPPHTHAYPAIAKAASTALCNWTLAHHHDILCFISSCLHLGGRGVLL